MYDKKDNYDKDYSQQGERRITTDHNISLRSTSKFRPNRILIGFRFPLQQYIEKYINMYLS
jgi:hypothetical protein